MAEVGAEGLKETLLDCMHSCLDMVHSIAVEQVAGEPESAAAAAIDPGLVAAAAVDVAEAGRSAVLVQRSMVAGIVVEIGRADPDLEMVMRADV